MDFQKQLLQGLGFNLGRRDGDQISHGLNLVLELLHPQEMPLLLIKIRQAQREAEDGLGELNFVHFARFLPTFDNKALQVITEFDGPLAPYVLDFIIEIGDVFDTLLSFTKGTQSLLPVAEHPDEFLAFVEQHNTVHVPAVSPVADWPLYAAYPEQTVVDIVGARADLPIPKADRPATPVDRPDVQGNILQGYRAEGARHFLLKVADAGLARKWLAGKASPSDTISGGVPQITSFAEWPDGTAPDLMLNVGLTYVGMQALGVRDKWCAPFPTAFKDGALKRADDNFDTGSNAPANWWLGGPQQVRDLHVMLSLYYRQGARPAFDAAALALTGSLGGGGLQLLDSHDAEYRNGVSWLGYADGIANPRIDTACTTPGQDTDLQPASTAGEFVLGHQYRNIYGGLSSLGALPPALATNGSFCAVRVLEQDVEGFQAAVQREAARLGVKDDWLAAKLMGRWFGGAPLSLHPDADPSNPAQNVRNDFDYAPSYEYPGTPPDQAGVRCPVGAHIRRGNPRSSRIAGARYARRLMRRGLHYDYPNADGTHAKGLFGMFICADLERQFEFIQRQWINGDRFTAGLRGTHDPFVGTPREPLSTFEIPMPAGAPPLRVDLPQFVFTKGSVYLFLPGLKALSDLDSFATQDPPLQAPRSKIDLSSRPQPFLNDSFLDVFGTLNRELAKLGAEMTFDKLLRIAREAVEPRQLRLIDHGMTRAHAASPQHLRFDPRRRDFQVNPYPVYAEFRAAERVHYSPLYEAWFVFGYDSVLRMCVENENFSAARRSDTTPRGLFTLDPPQHTEVRERVQKAWDAVAGGFQASIKRSIDNTLQALASQPCFDLVDDFARPVPRDVYFDFLGGPDIDAATRLRLDELARRVMKYHDHTLDSIQQLDGTLAGLELSARLGLMLVEARLLGRFKGTFLAHLADEVDWLGGGPFGKTVAITTLVNLTVAGYMSVEFLLATGIRQLLLDKPAGWDRVVSDPSSVKDKFLPEMRRTSPALSVIDRYALQDVHFADGGGVTIRKGDSVYGVLASANRDETVFANPDTFDPDRKSSKSHLGLGAGTHNCMGRTLEAMITEPAIIELSKAMPRLRLQSDAQPPWFQNFYFRSFDHLAVSVK